MKSNSLSTFVHQIMTLFICVSLLSACSSDGESEVDPIVGTWVGISFQEDLGPIELELTITEMAGVITGNLRSELNDLSMCNDDIFICEPGTCTTRWTFVSQSGSNYQFLETLISGDCVEEADISVDLISNDRLEGTASFDVDPSDLVEIEINEINFSRQ